MWESSLVISYTVPLHNPLTGVALATKSWDSLWLVPGASDGSVTNNLLLHKQNIFFVEMESENYISTENRSDWLADDNNLAWSILKPDLYIGFFSRDCVEVRYHHTLTCEDALRWETVWKGEGGGGLLHSNMKKKAKSCLKTSLWTVKDVIIKFLTCTLLEAFLFCFDLPYNFNFPFY